MFEEDNPRQKSPDKKKMSAKVRPKLLKAAVIVIVVVAVVVAVEVVAIAIVVVVVVVAAENPITL